MEELTGEKKVLPFQRSFDLECRSRLYISITETLNCYSGTASRPDEHCISWSHRLMSAFIRRQSASLTVLCHFTASSSSAASPLVPDVVVVEEKSETFCL